MLKPYAADVYEKKYLSFQLIESIDDAASKHSGIKPNGQLICGKKVPYLSTSPHGDR
jgi:hypothetical protein